MSLHRLASRLTHVVASLAALAMFGALGMLGACGAPDPAGPTVRPGSPAALDSAERPVYSPGDTLFASVVVTWGHSCALTRGGRAFCWGQDNDGQLGVVRRVGSCPGNAAVGTCSDTPVAVDSGRRFVALTTNMSRVCGLTAVGRVWCWGGSFRGPHLEPSGDTRYAALADSSSCAVTTRGEVDCFGPATLPTTQIPAGVTVARLPGSDGVHFASVATTCGTTTDGAMYCWDFVDTTRFAVAGVQHDVCRVGTGGRPAIEYNCHYLPVRLLVGGTWRRALRDQPCCGITRDGTLAVWNDDVSGVRWWPDAIFLGPRRPAAGTPATPIALPEPVRDAVVGELSCAYGVSGRVWCWGTGGHSGIWGNGIVNESHTLPTLAAGGRTFVSMQQSIDHACGVTAAGDVLCWGQNDRGQLGLGAIRNECPDGVVACVSTPTRIASIAGLR